MKKVSLIAQWAFEYGGQSVKAGEEFSANEKDAELMLLRGSVVKAEPKKRSYQRRDMVAETP